MGSAANPNAAVQIQNGITVQTEAGGTPGVVNVGTLASSGTNTLSFNGTQTFDNAAINLSSATGSTPRLLFTPSTAR